MNNTFIIDPSFPTKAMIEVSNVCNHNCVFCSNSISRRKKGFISESTIIRLINELGERKIKELSFHGMGEPLCNPNLEDYIRHAKNCGIEYVYIDTNLGLATSERLESIIEAGIDSIKISLSAADRDTFIKVQGRDDYENVIANVENILSIKARRPNLKVYIDFVRTSINDGQEQILKEKYEKRVTAFWVSDVLNQGGNMAGRIEHLIVHKTIPGLCTEPFERLNVTKDGYVTACCMDNNDNLVLGDLSEDSIERIWHSDKAKKIRNAMITGNELPPICAMCDMSKPFQRH